MSSPYLQYFSCIFNYESPITSMTTGTAIVGAQPLASMVGQQVTLIGGSHPNEIRTVQSVSTTYPYSITFTSSASWTDHNTIEGPATTVTNVIQFLTDEKIMQVGQFTLTLNIADPATLGINKGHYVQVFEGLTNPVNTWSGYVNTITMNPGEQKTYDIVFDDAAIRLSEYRTGDDMVQMYPRYQNVGEVLNGITGKNTVQGFFGLLPPGWKAVWHDPVWYEDDPIKGTIQHGGKNWPGHGDSWASALDTSLANLNTLAQEYNFKWRIDPGSKRYQGTIICGPMGDEASVEVWGGQPLCNQIQNQLGITCPEGQPNVALARDLGYSVIVAPRYTDTENNVWNVYIAPGLGTHHDQITLRSFWPYAPDSSAAQSLYGAPFTDPGGKTYFRGPSVTNWNGHVYQLVAFYRNRDDAGRFEFGAADLDSINQYNVRENVLQRKNRRIVDAFHLLSATLGSLAMNAQPNPSMQIAVVHPRTDANRIPPHVKAGQILKVHYQGAVPAYVIDGNPSSATYGMEIPNGNFQYLGWPGNTDAYDQRLQQQVIEVKETYAGGTHQSVYTLGRGVFKYQDYQDQLATAIEDESYSAKDKHNFAHHWFGHVSWLFSQSPVAWEWNKVAVLSAGASIVSDVPDQTFFGDNNKVKFTVIMNDALQYLDFLFNKPVWDAKNMSVHPMACFRLAMNGSGKSTGFHYTTDGSTWNPKGAIVEHRNTTFAPDQFEVEIKWSRGIYTAHVTVNSSAEQQHSVLVAHWEDSDHNIDWTDDTKGAVGFHLVGGSLAATITNFAAHPHRFGSTHHHGGGGDKHPHHGHTHHHPKGHNHRHRHHHQPQLLPGGGSTSHHHKTTGKHDHRGHAHHRGHVAHGSHLHHSAKMTNSITGGSTTVVTFDKTYDEYSLQRGDHVYVADDSARGDWVIVKWVTRDSWQRVTGFTARDPFLYSHSANTHCWWENIERDNFGHQHKGHAIAKRKRHDRHAGKVSVHKVEHGQSHHIYHPDGSMSHSRGGVILNSKGEVVRTAQESMSGAEMSKGLERSGFVFFDADSYNSGTQTAFSYNNTTSPSSVTIDLTGGAPGSGNQATWVTSISGGPLQIGDRVLALTGQGGNSAVRWTDSAIYDGAGNAIAWTPGHDVSLSVPIWVSSSSSPMLGSGTVIEGTCNALKSPVNLGTLTTSSDIYIDWNGSQGGGAFTLRTTTVGGSPSAAASNVITLGKVTTSTILVVGITNFIPGVLSGLGITGVGNNLTVGVTVAAGSANVPNQLPNEILVEYDVTDLGAAVSDVWVVNPGGSNVEKVTLDSSTPTDTANNGLILSAATSYGHNIGESLFLYQLAGGTFIKGAGRPMDGSVTLSDQIANIEGVMIGVTDGLSWWRVFWGDPTWKAPWAYTASTTLNQVGGTKVGATTWVVASASALSAGQYVTLDDGLNQEVARIFSIASNTLTFYTNLRKAHVNGVNLYPSPMPKWMGYVTAKASGWTDLKARMSDFGAYAPGAGQVLSGVDMGVYTASGTETVYFDAHQAGATHHPNRIPQGSVRKKHIGANQVSGEHKNFGFTLADTVIGSQSASAGSNVSLTTWTANAASTITWHLNTYPGISTIPQVQRLARSLEIGGWQVSINDITTPSTVALWGKTFGLLPATTFQYTSGTFHLPGDGVYAILINSILEPDPTATDPIVVISYQLLTPGTNGGTALPGDTFDIHLRWMGLVTH